MPVIRAKGILLFLPSFLILVLLSTPTRADEKPVSGKIAQCIRSPKCRQLFVVAHRGNGFGAPENSREAVRKAIAAGVPVIETDIRVSEDEQLFILHDEKLERTTSGQGKIKNLNSAELGSVLLKNEETLPRFQDFYELARGKAVLYLHFKTDAIKEVAKWIAAYGSFDDVLFFAENEKLMQSAARMKKKFPTMMVIARLRKERGLDLAKIEEIFGALPEVIHTDIPERDDVEKIRSQGAKILINSSRLERTLQPLGEDAMFARLFMLPADFFETDQPLIFLEKLSRGTFHKN